MPNFQELYKVTHSSSEIKTVGEYVNELNSPGFHYKDNPEAFLRVVGDDGLTNRQRIEGTFKTPEEQVNIGKSAKYLPLKPGILLYLEYEKVNQSSFITEGIEMVSTNEAAFKAAKLIELEADAGYVSLDFNINSVLNGKFKDSIPDITVWIWCRSISSALDEDGELGGEIFDLSPFIQKCNTNMGKNGGNWQLIVPPLMCELDSQNRWVLRKSTFDEYENSKNLSLTGTGYAASSTLFSPGEDENGDPSLVRSQFLFHNLINPNDLIFIRFETLKMEAKQRYSDKDEKYISKDNLANRIYDMIGLVDSNHQTTIPANNDVATSIQGRDLSKLFIEDGTYFYALENSQGILKLAGQSTMKSSLIQRIFSDGALNFIGLYNFTSIEYIFKFVIQQLSNIKVVPNNLFSSYAKCTRVVDGQTETYDGRNTRFNEIENLLKKTPNGAVNKKQFKQELANGIFQIVKLVIDESVSQRRLADSSFSTAQGSILNFLRSAAQDPLVEMYMDTYKDMYHLIVRKPPYDQKALISLIEGKVNSEDPTLTIPPAIIDIEEEDVFQESLAYDDSQVYSWYHFFPKNCLIGSAQEYALSYLPAIYFPEYAEIFGSKSFQQSNSYLPYVPMQNQNNTDIDYKQAIEDLKYVIESNQYLPFTRKGTLTLNRDRRIKIGNVIRYKPTGEIFFVDHVQHTHAINDQSVEAATTIQVSRGMVEQLIYGVFFQNESGATRYVSYFNIIDTRLNLKEKEYTRTVMRTREIKGSNPYLAPTQDLADVPSISSQSGNFLSSTINKGVANLEKYNGYPENKRLFTRFINAINDLGYKVTITSSNRSWGEQYFLKYGNGPSSSLNNAEPGHSKHESGSAIDINITSLKTDALYSKTTSEAEWRSTGVPTLANSMGLQWGGPSNDGAFGSYIDRVHFQIIGSDDVNADHEPIVEEYEQIIKSKGLDLDGVFSNFKVNKFSFNFFMKNGQNRPEYRNVYSKIVYDSDGEVLQGITVTNKKIN